MSYAFYFTLLWKIEILVSKMKVIPKNWVNCLKLSQSYFQSTCRLVLSFYTDEKVIMQTYDSEIAYQGNSK